MGTQQREVKDSRTAAIVFSKFSCEIAWF